MNKYINTEEAHSSKNSIPSNAVAIYPQGESLDDFPVLKAFQQYVDAEQAKAHRRLMSVCVFFTIFIVLLVGVFVAILLTWRHDPTYQLTLNALANNNSQLQKQLFEQNQKLLSSIANNPPESSLSAKSELDKFMKELKAEMDAKIKSAVQVPQQSTIETPPSQQTNPSPSQIDFKAREEALAKREMEIKQQAEKLRKNEEKLRLEQERAKQIAEHRRKLYPEFFDENGVERTTPVQPKVKPLDDELAAEIEAIKQLNNSKKAQKGIKNNNKNNNNDDIDELNAILEDAGISGESEKKEEPKKKIEPDVLDLNVGNGDGTNWTIPLE